MKSMIAVVVLTIVSATSAMADGQMLCKTAPNKFNGFTSITVTETDAYDATLKGVVSGGIAKFIREIPSVNVKVEHEADMTIYTNSEEGVKLTVVTTPMGGRLVSSASFQEGKEFPAVQVTCQLQ
jgi:hypothetical protein